MKQQHLILIIALLSIVMFGWFFVSAENNNPKSLVGVITPSSSNNNDSFLQDPTSVNLRQLLYDASVLVPEVQPETVVVLKGEVTEYGSFGSSGSSPSGTIALGPAVLGTTDLIFTTIIVNTGGSGDFMYLAAFAPQNEVYNMVAYKGLGDRIRIDKFALLDPNTVEILYRVHGQSQAMAEEPNQKEVASFKYENGVFVRR